MNFLNKKTFRRSHNARFLAWLFVHNVIDIAAILTSRPGRPGTKKRVVFARLDGLGDYTIWSSTFPTISEIYPSSDFERILIGNSKWQQLAEHDSVFDRKIFLDPDRLVLDLRYRLSVMRSVRELGADIIVNPKLTREFLWVDSIVRCSGARERVGSLGFDNLMSRLQERVANRWYTRLTPPREIHEHEITAGFRFLSDLVGGNGDIAPSLPSMHEAPSGRTGPDRDYAVFFVGAHTPDRRWPVAKVVEAAEIVAARYGFEIVLCGGPGDRDVADAFGELYPHRFTDLIGSTTLLDLTRVLREAKLVVSNDTGGAHMATALGVPTVVVTPGNQVGRFFPYPDMEGVAQVSVLHEMPCFGCGWTCKFKDLGPADPKPCVGLVEVEAVLSAVSKVMDPAGPCRA